MKPKSLEARIRYNRKRNSIILRQIRKLTAELHESLGELTDVQAEKVIGQLKKAIGKLI